MKTLAIAAFMLTCTLAGAQTKKQATPSSESSRSSYCMELKGDALILMKDGKQVFTDIKLDDGTRITTNGRILKPDGTEKLLKEKECADLDGQILEPVAEKK